MNIIIKTRIFPSGLMLFENLESNGYIEINDHTVKYNIFPLKTMYYNESYCLSIVLDDSFSFEKYKSNMYPNPIKLLIYILPNGMISVNHFYELSDEIADLSSLVDFSSMLFNAIHEFDILIYNLIEKFKRKEILQSISPITYDLLSTPNQKNFHKEMKWRAWATSNIICDKDVEASNDSLKKYTLHGYNIKLEKIYTNLYRWYLPNNCKSSEIEPYILEPVSYVLSYRTIIESANRNIEKITQDYILNNKLIINSLLLRKYMNHIKLKVIKTKQYEGSSNKFTRSIYENLYQDHNIDKLIAELDNSNELIYNTLESSKHEKSEKTSFYLNFVAVIFTGLAFISVIADLVGLIDYHKTLLDFKPRLIIVLLSLLIVLFILLLTKKRIKK
ncbi:MAG: hypothetical protein K9I74_02625 [Bacteroidales bacterium]|nr:hypothetical protein [Bacteroidales bacterium]